MDQKWEKRIAEYLDILQNIRKQVGDERTAVSILQEINKDFRMAIIREERGNGNSEPDFPATQRQRSFLKKLGVKIPDKVSKREASALIDEELGRESEQGSSTRVREENVVIPWYGAHTP